MLEWGYPVLVATLVQAVVASLVLILLPLWIRARGAGQRDQAGWSRLRIAAYFTAIGFAFMFIEIAFIQKFLLFLSHPLYAVAVVLCAFLVFAGLGSRYSGRAAAVSGASLAWPVARPIAGIAVLASLYLIVLAALFRELMPLPDGFKIMISMHQRLCLGRRGDCRHVVGDSRRVRHRRAGCAPPVRAGGGSLSLGAAAREAPDCHSLPDIPQWRPGNG